MRFAAWQLFLSVIEKSFPVNADYLEFLTHRVHAVAGKLRRALSASVSP